MQSAPTHKMVACSPGLIANRLHATLAPRKPQNTIVDLRLANYQSPIPSHHAPPLGGPMGRGAQVQTQQMIDQQLSQQNAMNQQIYGSSQALGSQAASGYQNLLANPGYSDTEKSAIDNLSQSALSSSFDALAQNAANRARRNNIAPYQAGRKMVRHRPRHRSRCCRHCPPLACSSQ